ncbi:sialoadhesin [Esox lucius]|uniref:sialoadhesin n=1 Tax=Esox lucius TaxID=8010 RepID=UPI00057686AB|nr:sialoadhesin [Esox lucius]
MGGGSIHEKRAGLPLGIILLMITECLSQDKGNVTYIPRKFCSLLGSSVTMRCSYTIPKDHKLINSSWYKLPVVGPPLDLSLDPEYKGRVEYVGDSYHLCTLRITDLRESDSGIYSFHLRTDVTPQMLMEDSGVILNVTGLHVDLNPERVVNGQWAVLHCGLCILSNSPTYIWYKDTKPLNDIKTNSYLELDPVGMEDSGNYSCAVRGIQDSAGPPVNLQVECGPNSTSVSVSPSSEIAEGVSVTLTCYSDTNPPVDKYTWYKKNDSQTAFSEIGSGQRYIILSITSEDSGQYFCKLENKYQPCDSAPVHLRLAGKSGFPWAPVVVVVALLAVGTLPVIIYYTVNKRNTRVSGDADVFSCGKPPRVGSPDDTYATLDRSNMSPEYDTLAGKNKPMPQRHMITGPYRGTISPGK